jgi:hypothetical protein
VRVRENGMDDVCVYVCVRARVCAFQVVRGCENVPLFKFWMLKMFPFLRDFCQKSALFKTTFEKRIPFQQFSAEFDTLIE